MAVIGTMAVNIVATTDKFIKGLHNAQAKLGGFVNKASVAGAAVTASFGAMLKSFEATGSQLNDMSIATGVSVEQLSFLKYAAEQSSTSLNTITKAARELQSKGIDPNKFQEMAAAIAAIEDPTKRAQEAFDLFGKRTGAAILPMLNDLPALKKRFDELGGGFTTDMAKNADKLGDAWGDVKLAMTNVANVIAAELAPAMTTFSKWLAENIGPFKDFVKEHSGWVKAIAAIALALPPIATGLWAINTAMLAIQNTVKATMAIKGAAALFGAAGVAGVAAAGAGVAAKGAVNVVSDAITGRENYKSKSREEIQANFRRMGWVEGPDGKWGPKVTDKLDKLIDATKANKPPQLNVAGVR